MTCDQSSQFTTTEVAVTWQHLGDDTLMGEPKQTGSTTYTTTREGWLTSTVDENVLQSHWEDEPDRVPGSAVLLPSGCKVLKRKRSSIT